MKVALVTGASRGLGLALGHALAARGWDLVIDGRGGEALAAAAAELGARTKVEAIPGDVSEEAHRAHLIEAAASLGSLGLLVNNASRLGPSPQPELAHYPLEELRRVYEVNVLAPIALSQLALPRIGAGTIINVTSDAAVEPYEGWGGYGSSKAALEQATCILAAENPTVHVYAVDPGDMNTRMQQEAFPEDDVSDRPSPQASVPGFLRLLEGDLPSGRYAARELVAAEAPR